MDIITYSKLQGALNQIKLSHDFIETSYFPWEVGALASGTVSTYTAAIAKHHGIRVFTSSTNANSGYRIYTAVGNINTIGGYEKTTLCFRTPSPFSATANIRFGIMKKVDHTASSDHIMIKIAADKLSGVCAKNSNETATATDYTLAANTWYRAVIEVNSDATAVTFTLYADDSNTVLWTSTVTEAANIPKAVTSLYHGLVAYDTGTTAVNLIVVDYIDLIFPNARKVV